MKSISEIKWNDNKAVATKKYIEFQLRVLKELKISFQDFEYNPVFIAENYINDKISYKEFNETIEYWWEVIDNKNALRNFNDKYILLARLAICLLSVNEKSYKELGMHLSWFFEVIEFLEFDLKIPIEIMEAFFDFEPPDGASMS